MQPLSLSPSLLPSPSRDPSDEENMTIHEVHQQVMTELQEKGSEVNEDASGIAPDVNAHAQIMNPIERSPSPTA